MNKRKTPAIRFKGYQNDWEQRKLADVAEIIGGGTPSTSNPDYWDGDIDWYAPAEIGEQIFAYGSVRKITKEGLIHSSAKILPAHKTVLFTSRAGIGNMAILKRPAATNQGFQSLVCHDDIDPYFMFSMGDSIKAKAERVAAGSTFAEISGKKLGELEFMFPDTDEQKAISVYFKNLDHLITLHQRKLEKLKILKKTMLENCFPQKGESVPRVRFGGFTGDWEQRKVGELTNVLSASRVHKEEWAEDGIPFFRSSDVVSAFKGTENKKAFISIELYEQLAKSSGKLEKNDILITGGGSIGIPYIVPDNKPLYSKDADLIWIKHSANFDSRYLYTYFISEEFREYLASISHMGTIPHYTIEQVKDTPVRLPSIDEQRELGDFFVSLDHLITLHQCKMEKLQTIKKSLLRSMFV